MLPKISSCFSCGSNELIDNRQTLIRVIFLKFKKLYLNVLNNLKIKYHNDGYFVGLAFDLTSKIRPIHVNQYFLI